MFVTSIGLENVYWANCFDPYTFTVNNNNLIATGVALIY